MNKHLEKETIALLKMLKADAEMALEGEWDRSDEGFKAQIRNIDEMLFKIKNQQK